MIQSLKLFYEGINGETQIISLSHCLIKNPLMTYYSSVSPWQLECQNTPLIRIMLPIASTLDSLFQHAHYPYGTIAM